MGIEWQCVFTEKHTEKKKVETENRKQEKNIDAINECVITEIGNIRVCMNSEHR